MKKAILVLIPVLLLTACGMPKDSTNDTSIIVGGKPGEGVSVSTNETLSGSITVGFKNRQALIAGEGNEISTNRSVFSYDLRKLFSAPETLDVGNAKLGLLFSAQQYDYLDVNTYKVTLMSSTIDFSNNVMGKAKLKDIKTYPIIENEYKVDPNDVCSFQLSHGEVNVNGDTKNLVVVSFAGTSSDVEWKSNLDIGSTVPTYMKDASEHPDWTNHKHFKGIDVAKNRAKVKIEEYIKENIVNTNPITYFVTGHSRGGAIANLYGKDLIDANKNAIVYTFNSPNTVEKDANMSQYNTIFNFENSDDLLSAIPEEAAGFTKYGKKYSIDFALQDSSKKTFATTFLDKMKYEYKALSSSNLNTVHNTLNDLMKSRDQLYSINEEANPSDSAIVQDMNAVEAKKKQILETAKKYGCEDKIIFNEPTKESNGKYKLTWRVSNSMVLDIVSKFLSHEIELDVNNLSSAFVILNELSTFAPTISNKIFSVITFLMSDTSKLGIPHTPESYFIGLDYLKK